MRAYTTQLSTQLDERQDFLVNKTSARVGTLQQSNTAKKSKHPSFLPSGNLT